MLAWVIINILSNVRNLNNEKVNLENENDGSMISGARLCL